jgi:hypothetical protein
MAIAWLRRMNPGGAAESRKCSVERVLAVQHNMQIAEGGQKVVVKTEEACGFGGSVRTSFLRSRKIATDRPQHAAMEVESRWSHLRRFDLDE